MHMEESAARDAQLDNRIDGTQLSITFKVSHDELKRNFEQLNGLLSLQWRHMDELRKSVRNVITYQKYFYPLQTQNIISESFMKLKEVQDDGPFISFQKELFQRHVGNILDIQEVAMQKSDFDLVNMIEDMIREEVCTSEWKVHVKADLDESKNFTLPIVQSFLDYKEKEHKAIKHCEPTKINLMRRIVTLNDIEEMIILEQNRAKDLVDEAHRIEREIMERERQRIIQKNTNRLQHRKLAFKASECTKRRYSFKGRVHKGVVRKGLEMHNLKNAVAKGVPRRATSSENNSRRVNGIRKTTKERDLRFDDGFIPMVVHDDKISEGSDNVNEGVISEGTLDDTIDECEDFLFGLELDMDEKTPREIAEELKRNYEIVTEQLTNLKQIEFTNPAEAVAFEDHK